MKHSAGDEAPAEPEGALPERKELGVCSLEWPLPRDNEPLATGTRGAKPVRPVLPARARAAESWERTSASWAFKSRSCARIAAICEARSLSTMLSQMGSWKVAGENCDDFAIKEERIWISYST
jgi:hypothetical protein